MNTTQILALATQFPFRDHDGPWGWGPGPLFLLVPLLFWTAIIVTLVVLARRRWRDHSGESTLADVFARGEITEEEYRARLAVLRENRR